MNAASPIFADNDAIRSEELLAAIADHDFPCLGAKAVMNQGTLKILVCNSLESASDDERIHRELLQWAMVHQRDSTILCSLAIIFDDPHAMDERAFEAAMWARLQSLADRDERLGQPYDQDVSSDPDDPHFSLSFGGSAFFVVGLHPNASRPARRMKRPTLIFNLHEQFERLRSDGRYEGMREKIIRRDIALAGDANPMLVRFGEGSEARQYSGRAVGKDWRCPYRDRRTA